MSWEVAYPSTRRPHWVADHQLLLVQSTWSEHTFARNMLWEGELAWAVLRHMNLHERLTMFPICVGESTAAKVKFELASFPILLDHQMTCGFRQCPRSAQGNGAGQALPR